MNSITFSTFKIHRCAGPPFAKRPHWGFSFILDNEKGNLKVKQTIPVMKTLSIFGLMVGGAYLNLNGAQGTEYPTDCPTPEPSYSPSPSPSSSFIAERKQRPEVHIVLEVTTEDTEEMKAIKEDLSSIVKSYNEDNDKNGKPDKKLNGEQKELLKRRITEYYELTNHFKLGTICAEYYWINIFNTKKEKHDAIDEKHKGEDYKKKVPMRIQWTPPAVT